MKGEWIISTNQTVQNDNELFGCEAEPTVVIELWLEELHSALERPTDEDFRAFEILSIVGKLRRVQPELLKSCDPLGYFRAGEECVRGRESEMIAQAIKVPSPAHWLADALCFEDDLATTAGEQLTGVARTLISDLEAMIIVIALAKAQGHDVSKLEAELRKCNSLLLEEETATFLDGCQYVRCIVGAMRQDQDIGDCGLAPALLERFRGWYQNMRNPRGFSPAESRLFKALCGFRESDIS